MDTCTADFERVAAQVGGIDCHDAGLLSLRSPFGLDSGTMPVIELLLVIGTIAALVHALRRRRRTGDSTNVLAFWASIAAPLFIEPIAYFPQWFGLEDRVGLTFLHNEFSVQFLYDRLPLYVFGMYAAFVCPLYLLVQRSGIVTRRHPLVSAATVSFTFVVLYELIDQVGPLLGWWVWNDQHPQIVSRIGVTPYSSLTGFSAAVPFAITLGTIAVGRRGWRLLPSVLLVAVLLWPTILAFGLPRQLFEAAGMTPSAAQVAGGSFVLLVLGAVCLAATWTAFRDVRPDGSEPDGPDRFTVVCLATYLATGVGVWAFALPEHLDAVDGIAVDGSEAGSLTFTVLCVAIGTALVVVGELTARRRRQDRHPQPLQTVGGTP